MTKPTALSLPGKYLTFVLGKVGYGIPILKVREIIRLLEVTALPQVPDYIRGVINLRGKIVPVIDLRLKFALKDVVTTNRTCIIVVQLTAAAPSTRLMGLIVDALEEVYEFAQEDIEPSPDFGRDNLSLCIEGIAKAKGQVKALLNLEHIVLEDEDLIALGAEHEALVGV